MLSTYGVGSTFLIKKLANHYQTNDFVYYTFPSIDSTINGTRCLQRVIGLPGDTIEIKQKLLYINNFLITDMPDLKHNYFIKSKIKLDTVFKTRYNLIEGGQISENLDYSFSLTALEADVLKKDSLIVKVTMKTELKDAFDETLFPYSHHFNWNMDNYGKLYIPKRNDTLTLDSINIYLYANLIITYEGNDLKIKNDSIFINQQYSKKYAVQKNYYFVMGDNRDNANDSRMCGFIPEDYIKGKVISVLRKK